MPVATIQLNIKIIGTEINEHKSLYILLFGLLKLPLFVFSLLITNDISQKFVSVIYVELFVELRRKLLKSLLQGGILFFNLLSKSSGKIVKKNISYFINVNFRIIIILLLCLYRYYYNVLKHYY